MKRHVATKANLIAGILCTLLSYQFLEPKLEYGFLKKAEASEKVISISGSKDISFQDGDISGDLAIDNNGVDNAVNNLSIGAGTSLKGTTQENKTITVSSGGSLDGNTFTNCNTTIQSGANERSNVFDGGTYSLSGISDGSTFQGGERRYVQSGGVLKNATLQNQAIFALMEGAKAENIILKDVAYLQILQGVEIKGDTNIVKGKLICYRYPDSVNDKYATDEENYRLENLITSNADNSIIELGTWSEEQQKIYSGVGRTLHIAKLKGSTFFQINTDLNAGKADQIYIGQTEDSTNNRLCILHDQDVELDKVIHTNGTKVISAPENFKITPVDSYIGAYKVTPVLEYRDNWWTITDILNEGANENVIRLTNSGNVTQSQWRENGLIFNGRMEELRREQSLGGIWAQINRDTLNSLGINNKITYATLGFDKRVKGYRFSDKWHVGAAFTYGSGSSAYDEGVGTGHSKSYALAGYASWQGRRGQFADFALWMGQVKNDFEMHYREQTCSGNFGEKGLGLTAKYGYKHNMTKKAYLEPYVLMGLDYIGGAKYTTAEKIYVDQKDTKSVYGKLGINLGFRPSKKTLLYTDIAYGRTFTGRNYADYSSNGYRPVRVDEELKDSWCDVEFGARYDINKKYRTWVSAGCHNLGGNITKGRWRYNMGMEWRF